MKFSEDLFSADSTVRAGERRGGAAVLAPRGSQSHSRHRAARTATVVQLYIQSSATKQVDMIQYFGSLGFQGLPSYDWIIAMAARAVGFGLRNTLVGWWRLRPLHHPTTWSYRCNALPGLVCDDSRE